MNIIKSFYFGQSPGNHEFDDHVSGFTPFLRNASFPIVAANVDARLEPELKGLIPPSVVVEVGASGRKVGVIGYVTTDTPDISNSDKVEFLDEVQSIREEAEKLKGMLGRENGKEVKQCVVAKSSFS